MRTGAASPLALALPVAWMALLSACPGPIGVPAEDDGGSGIVVESCSLLDPCDEGLTCCGGTCVDTNGSPDHCGACGNACGADGYCATGARCVEARVGNLCANDSYVAVLNGNTNDDQAVGELRGALEERCPDATFVSVGENEPGVLDPETGQPRLPGGNTLVFAGGSFFNDAVAWLEAEGLTPVYFERTGGMLRFRAQDDRRIIAELPEAELTPAHDFFVAELVTEPQFGAQVLIVYGFESAGTRAGTWYFTRRVLPDPANDDARWYVGEWTDDDGDGAPGDGDTFRILERWPGPA